MNAHQNVTAETALTVGDVLRRHGRTRPDAPAMQFGARRISYKTFDQHTNQVARALEKAGISKGDRVAFLGKNSDYFFEIMFGCAKMGAVCLPIGWRLAAAEVAHILKDGTVALLFIDAAFKSVADAAIKQLGRALPVIEVDSESAAGFAAWRDAESVDDLGREITPHDAALQLYTSGTTGHPKGVVLSHANLLVNWTNVGEQNYSWFKWEDGDVGLVAMPIAHVGGTCSALIGFLYGAKNVILAEFDPQAVLQLMAPERISIMFMVPAALNFLLQMPGAREVDYSHLRLVLYGASPIPLDLLKQCIDVFGCQFCQQYGMTEASGTIVYLPPEDHDPNGNERMRSAGLPFPSVELKIIDADGNTLPEGVVGEVATRSPGNMLGYWNNDAATRSTIDADGWLKTGDAGYLDADGYLFIHDRVKDMIVSGAENVYPAEVESVMFGHPDIAEVAVIGVPDDTWGEAVKAVVVLKPGATATADTLLAYTRGQIAPFKVPKSVDFVDMLPRNPSGKVLKRVLREPYWKGRDRAVN